MPAAGRAARGYKAVDADCDQFSEWVKSGDAAALEAGIGWVWRKGRIEDLLSTEDAECNTGIESMLA